MQKLVVRNFGPIEEAEIEIRDFVVLIGEQGSGKSTLAKLVYLFNNLMDTFDFEDLIDTENSQDALEKLLGRPLQNRFIDYFGIPADLGEFEISFFYDTAGRKSIKILNNKNLNNENYIVQVSFSDELRNSVRENLSFLISQASSIEAYSGYSEYIEFITETFEISDTTFYIPASRNIITGFSKIVERYVIEEINRKNNLFNNSNLILVDNFFEYSQRQVLKLAEHGSFEKFFINHQHVKRIHNIPLVELFLKKYAAILKGEYRVDSNSEAILVGNEKVLMQNASSGQQEVIRLLLDILISLVDDNKGLRIIEEPEAHLFPSAQKNLIELYGLLCNKKNKTKIFITTHSPYILSTVSNLTYAYKTANTDGIKEEEKKEIRQVIDQNFWLNPDKLAAYSLDNQNNTRAVSKSIISDKTKMISQNYLDEIGMTLGLQFQALYNLRAKVIQRN